MKKAFIICSRNRPERLEKTIASILHFAEDPANVFFYIYLDIDEPKLRKYKNLAKQFNNIIFKIAGAEYITRATNLLCDMAYEDGQDILLTGGDDIVFTNYWDQELESFVRKITDGIYCCWFNDGDKSYNAPSFPIISRQWYEILGYMSPEVFMHFIADRWVFYIASHIDRAFYLSHIKLEHQMKKEKNESTARRSEWKRDFDTATADAYKHLIKIHAERLLEHCQPLPQSFYHNMNLV